MLEADVGCTCIFRFSAIFHSPLSQTLPISAGMTIVAGAGVLQMLQHNTETVPSSVGMTIVAGAGVLKMVQHNTEVRCWKLTWAVYVYSASLALPRPNPMTLQTSNYPA
ncbi:hypothetical protein J6590_076345 [Homalodisca vitripennis]|nr:hypothetical protein J6590_076345 [Homalodisca vitripennis]